MPRCWCSPAFVAESRKYEEYDSSRVDFAPGVKTRFLQPSRHEYASGKMGHDGYDPPVGLGLQSVRRGDAERQHCREGTCVEVKIGQRGIMLTPNEVCASSNSQRDDGWLCLAC